MPVQELVGIFDQERNRFESNYAVGMLTNKTTIVGVSEPGELITGMEYVFFGDWKKHAKYGNQFAFVGFTRRQPTTRRGVLEYLKRLEMLSEVRLQRIADIEGYENVINRLKTDPQGVAFRAFNGDRLYRDLASRVLSLSAALIQDNQFQETKLQLLDLLAGRGFPHNLPEEAARKFGVLAPVRIRRDPFCLLVAKLPGCGFLRCDALYVELGLPLDRMRRQIMCALHAIRSDSSGTTWHGWDEIAKTIGEQLSGNVRIDRALRAAVRMKWLVTRTIDGKVWLADRKRATNEDEIANRLKVLLT